MFQCDARNLTGSEYRIALGLLYDGINGNLGLALKDLPGMHMWIDQAASEFPRFWREIGAKGDLDRAVREFRTKHNASPS